MGSQQGKVQSANTQENINHTTGYSLDFRLIEKFLSVPSYFSSSTQKIIQEIEQLSTRIQFHPLEQYLINCIDLRFSKYNKLNMEAVNAGKQPIEVLSIDETPFSNLRWFELQNKERFLGILDLLKRQYEIECLIQQEYLLVCQNSNKKGFFDTLRKPIKGQSIIVMDQGLIVRLFYHYYAIIIKTYANSGEKHIFKFHEETGRQLCLMILHGYLNLEQLYELFYLMVYIDKHPKQITSKLSIINHLYHSKCLTTFYTINVEKKQRQLLLTTARLYLDELYLNSIREAQDPEIKNTDDTLMPIKMFPISRVKDKPKI